MKEIFLYQHPQKIIFLLSLIILIISTYSSGIIGYNTRTVDFIAWMQQHGPTLFPIINGTPYPDYMISYFMLAYFFTLIFGHLSVLTLELPFCIAGAITIVYIYKLGSLYDKSWGIYGALFALFTWKFFDGINSLELDIFSMMAMSMACYFVTVSHLKQNKIAFCCIFVSLILGFLFRGPIGFIAPGFVIFLYYSIHKQWKTLILYSMIAGILFLLCSASLFLAAYLYGGNDFLQQVIQFQAVERLSHDHLPRYYFYFSVALINYLFTVFFSLSAIFLLRKKIIFPKTNNEKFLQFLVLWFISILVLFTIPNTKKARYVLSIVPAISLIAAYLFVLKDKFTKTKKILNLLCFIFPFVGFLTAIGIMSYNFFGGNITICPIGSLIFLIPLVLWSVRLKFYSPDFTHHPQAWLLIGALSYIAINTFIAVPIQLTHAALTPDNAVLLSFFPWKV